jgi:hypothetical protein
MYKKDAPSGYISGTRGEGGQIMGDYYWGLGATPTETTGHSYLTVPAIYGTGEYCLNVQAWLGQWDGCYYDDWMWDPPTGDYGPEFVVNRFESALPTPTATMTNPGSDSMIVVNIPPYSTFADYISGYPPAKYAIEISTELTFPAPRVLEAPETVYAYVDAEDKTMEVGVDVSDLAVHGITPLHGRIKCLGPDLQYWTERDPVLIGTIGVIHWNTRLDTPLSFTVVNDPDALGRDDSTIQVEIPVYTGGDEQHTGYIVEVSPTGDFDADDWPWVQAIYWHTKTGTGKIEDAVPVDEDVTIDVNLDLDAYRAILGTTLTSPVYVRVLANKNGYKPSDPTTVQSVIVVDTKLLETPVASYTNPGGDLVIQATVTPAAVRTVKETGYIVDVILGDQNFTDPSILYGDMHHVIYNHDDPLVVGRPDEVNDAVIFNINMRDAVTSGLFTAADLETKDVKIRVSSIRGGFTPSDPTSPEVVLIDTSAKLLSTPPGFTVVNDPDGLGRDDSTIQVNIPSGYRLAMGPGYILVHPDRFR